LTGGGCSGRRSSVAASASVLQRGQRLPLRTQLILESMYIGK
jgi:hypothetical protein